MCTFAYTSIYANTLLLLVHAEQYSIFLYNCNYDFHELASFRLNEIKYTDI